MDRQQYDKIITKIYENGRVLADDDNSEDIEFDFEAKEQGFSAEEIKEAREQYS